MKPDIPTPPRDEPPELPTKLPRGPHRLPREVVEASQRWRLLAAAAEAVAEKGYGATTVADIIARAGISRKTFYVYFRDKEDCFLAGYDAGVEVLLDAMKAAGDDQPDQLQRLRARVRTFLETLADNPAFARTFVSEITAAGPRALERRRAVHQQFVELARGALAAARREFPDMPEIPDELHLAAVAATNEVVSEWVAAGRTAELPLLEDTVVHIQLAMLVPQRKPPPSPAKPRRRTRRAG